MALTFWGGCSGVKQLKQKAAGASAHVCSVVSPICELLKQFLGAGCCEFRQKLKGCGDMCVYMGVNVMRRQVLTRLPSSLAPPHHPTPLPMQHCPALHSARRAGLPPAIPALCATWPSSCGHLPPWVLMPRQQREGRQSY